MILQALHELYGRLATDERHEIVRPGYSVQKIAFRIVLRDDGTLFAIEDARETRGKRLVPRPLAVPGSSKPTGQGINPGFLWDNAAYLLGFKDEDPKPDRTRLAFETLRERHLEREEEIDSPAYSAVCRFLECWDPESATEHEVLLELTSGFGVFQILGRTCYVHEDEKVAAWWDARSNAVGEGPHEPCLVTGQVGPVARTHLPKIKGVAGGQSSGCVLVGFNESAYESYGKGQSHNAPVSVDAAFRYGVALNALLDGPMRRKHSMTLGDMTVVFWTGAPCLVEDVFAAFATRGSSAEKTAEAQDESLRKQLELFVAALRRGRNAFDELDVDTEGIRYHLLGLSPNAARLSVRSFHRGALSDLLENLRRHHSDIAIERRWGDDAKRPDPAFPSLRQLLDQTCPTKAGRPDRDKIPSVLAGPLLRAVLEGTMYPQGLYAAVLRRLAADRTVGYLRACVLKGYLNRNLNLEVGMSLDKERPEPAYRLGRLFASLEKSQGDALGTLNASIRDRYYGSASATPRSVFPRLLRTYQHHLAKLEGGRRVLREKLVQEILSPLDDFPSHLDLAGQGLFALGYYHQTNDFYVKKDDRDTPESEEGEER